jgi:histidinol-phosphate aminotransferase
MRSADGLSALARERIAQLQPYRPGASIGGSGFGKLSSNESSMGASPLVAEALVQMIGSVSRYPRCEALTELLAEDAGIPADRLIVTNGSDELCSLLACLLLERGTRVVLSRPGYAIEAAVSRVQLATCVAISLRDGRHDLDAMAEAAQGAALVWLPNPHNPTGTAVGPDAIARFLDAVPADCVVVLDEAYRPFADPDLWPDVPALLERHSNLFVQRTFSKVHGLAGLRLGYGMGDAGLIAALRALRMPFSVNAAALAAGEAALRDRAWTDAVVESTVAVRTRFEAFLAMRRIEHWPSQANFVTLRPTSAAHLHEELARVGVAVRDGSDLGIPGWVRVTIGTEGEMRLVRDAIDRASAS